MPQGSTQQLYDLARLRPLVAAGHQLLTPNYRLARRIKAEWDQQQVAAGLDCWQPLPVLALETWLDQRWQDALGAAAVSPGVILDPVRVNELWLQVIAADSEANPTFSLLQPAAAAELAAQARDNLLRWQVDTTSESVLSAFRLDPDCATFLRWLQAFERRLEEGGLLTRSDCYRDLLASGFGGSRPAVALLEFDDIPPLYQACIDQLASGWQRLDSDHAPAPVEVLAFEDRRQELAAVARWAAEQHRQSPQQTIGIVLADMHGDRAAVEYLLRREFDCLGDNYTSLPVNFSTGISLDRAPVIRDALRMLSVCSQHLPLADVLGLLQSRFSGQDGRRNSSTIKLIEELYRRGSEQIDTGQLRYLAQTVTVGEGYDIAMGGVLADVAELRLQRERQLPSAWVERLCQVLDIWGWPGRGPLDSLEYQQVEQWYRLLENFAGQDLVHGRLPLGAALQLLRRCCQGQVFQPQTADSAVQVLGPLEGAGLHFDTLWLCGLQGSRWPAPARPNPFLPMAMQRARGMPHATAEREWQFAAGLLARYRRHSERVRTSYSRHLDGIPELPSPLLAGFAVQEGDTSSGPPAHWQYIEDSMEALEDAMAPALDSAEREGLSGGSGILQDQANCPFRAFASHRLGLRALDDFHTGLTAAERGTLLHDALYSLWGELGDSEHLAALDDDQAAALAGRAAADAIEAVPARARHSAGLHCLDLERQRLQQLLLEWLQLEKRREPFRVAAREAPVEYDLAGLPLRLRVDRVDELADGSRLVIDYKSGSNSLAHWLGERPSQPQLPLYGLATEVKGLAFAEVRARKSRFLGLGCTAGIPGVQVDIGKAVTRYVPMEDWGALRDAWLRDLEALASQFLDGQAAVDPLPGACTFCGYRALCRVELAVEAGS